MANQSATGASSARRSWFIGVFAFLTVAVIGLGSAYLQYRASNETMLELIRSEVERMAIQASSRIDTAKLERLHANRSDESREYLELNEALDEFLRENPTIRYVYTLQKVDDGLQFVLDPTMPGDTDADGVDDKSYLGDPVEHVSPEMRRAFDSGMITTEEKPYRDSWGNWLSAYAPLKNKSGETIGFVGVDLPATVIDEKSAPLFDRFKVTSLGVLIVAVLFAWTIATALKQPSKEAMTDLVARVRPHAIEIGLVTATLVAFLVAGFAYLTMVTSAADMSRSSNRILVLSNGERAASAIAQGNLSFDFGTTIEDMLAAGDNTTSKRLSALRYMADSDLRRAKQGGVELRTKILEDIGRQKTLSEEAAGRMRTSLTAVVVSLCTALLLAVCSIVMMRFATNQARRLRDVERSTANVSESYRTLVESMPLGVVNFKDGRIAYSNNDWTVRLLSAHATIGASAPTGLDLEIQRVITGLTNAEARRQGWNSIIQVTREGVQREVDVRATPIFDANGAYLHLLTFFVDVTDLRHAARNLEFKNQELENKSELLQQALEQLEGNFESIVRALVRAVEAKDPYTAGHSERVMQYALWCADELELGPYERRILEMGCLVHDIGKIGIPDNVLTKPGQLTDEEFALIKKHPEYGAAIVRNVELFRECLPIILWHHERLNGTGYPDRLKGDEIPFLVRITSLADVFDAMTSTRSYRVGMPLEKVMRIIEEDTEKGHFDPEVVEAFKRVITRNGIIAQNDIESPFSQAA